MRTVLDRICRDKREHVATAKSAVSLTDLEGQAKAAAAPRGFAEVFERQTEADGFSLICEIKKASPSKGLIRNDFDPATLAAAYERGGAACLSVLTDTPYFQGADAHLAAAHGGASLPVLRKDFMLDPYQIVESRALGADCILLILAALSDAQAWDLAATAREWGMEVLAEIHDEAELDRALRLETALIGINNRNLKTLDVDLDTTRRLAPRVPKARLTVCESGLFTPADLAEMIAHGACGFLIGESLMRQNDVALATARLRDGVLAARGIPAEVS